MGWLVPPLVIVLAASWGRRRASALAVVGGTGFAGMTLQIVLLLTFQALYGYVYYQVGLLVTAFMGGLAVGAGAMSTRRLLPKGLDVRGRWLLRIQGGLAAYALVLALALWFTLPLPAMVFPLLAAVAGVLTGAVFPVAAAFSVAGRATSHIAGLLYGADLIGGCIGALAASIILVPVLGVVQTCLAVALVAGAGALLSVRHSF
jgi:spermidine synthase